MRVAFQIVQQNDGALIRAQAAERSKQSAPQLASLQRIFWCSRRRSRRRKLDARRSPNRQPGPSFERLIPNDAQQPWAEALRIPALAEPVERAHERVLADVLGFVGITQQGKRNRVRRAGMTPDERFECCTLPRQHARDALGVRHTLNGCPVVFANCSRSRRRPLAPPQH